MSRAKESRTENRHTHRCWPSEKDDGLCESNLQSSLAHDCLETIGLAGEYDG
jgi:hypothetical protein